MDNEAKKKAFNLFRDKQYLDRQVKDNYTYKKRKPGCNTSLYFSHSLGKYYLLGNFLSIAVMEFAMNYYDNTNSKFDLNKIETDSYIQQWIKDSQANFIFKQLRNL